MNKNKSIILQKYHHEGKKRLIAQAFFFKYRQKMPLTQNDGTSIGGHSTNKQPFNGTLTMGGISFACVKVIADLSDTN